MKRYILALAAISAATTFAFTRLSSAQCGGGMHASGHDTHAEIASSEKKVIVYPIDYCIVSGEKLGEMGDPVKYEYKDRTVYFCCTGCIKKFEAEPAKYIAVLDAAVAATVPATVEAKPATAIDTKTPKAVVVDTTGAKVISKLTTLDWCIVSGETLGGMGKTIPYEYKDREITFCCKGCIKEFEKTPTAYLARLDSALAGQIKQPVEAEEVKDEQKDGTSHH